MKPTPQATALKSSEFRRERESSWTELEGLVQIVEKRGTRQLTARELNRLPQLYRATLSSLSVARAISLDRNLLHYLESLAGRAYYCVYGPKRHVRETVGDFFATRFPAMVRRYKWFMAVSFLCMILGTTAAFVMTADDPDRFYSFVPQSYSAGRGPGASTAFLRRGLYDGNESALEGLGAFATALFTHNARVGMLAFALGFAAGLPVIYLMFQNGLILGAFAALYHSRGLGLDLWGWLLPHGVTELGAVVLCGGAGLILGQSLVFPGTYTRLQNLAIRGRDAGVIVLGAVVMLFIAGLIEGFFRQLVTSIVIRYSVVLISVLLWGAYFGWCGRARE